MQINPFKLIRYFQITQCYYVLVNFTKTCYSFQKAKIYIPFENQKRFNQQHTVISICVETALLSVQKKNQR